MRRIVSSIVDGSIHQAAPLAALLLVALMFTAADASAQARKTFVDCTVDGSGNVVVNHEIKGVGNGDLCVVASTTFTAKCACRNLGGNCPHDAQKQAESFPVSEGQVEEPRNGRIQGTQLLVAPTDTDCEAVLMCPGNQEPILAEVVVPAASVEVFDEFEETDGTCAPSMGATAIRSATCTPASTTVTFDAECAALFD